MSRLRLLLAVLLTASQLRSQQSPLHPELKQYPSGYPKSSLTLLQQLQHYPSPRYFPAHQLEYLFNWMDPYYMAGNGQPGINRQEVVRNAVEIQKLLAARWHYGFVIPNSAAAFNDAGGYNNIPPFVKMANENPGVPLHVITFWMGVNPTLAGYNYPRAMVLNTKIDSTKTLTFDFYGNPKTEINYNFPDSLLRIDGFTQKYYLSRITRWLTRPVDVINEDGEEPPGPYMLDAIKKSKAVCHMKDSMKIDSWENFMAARKLQMRNAYSSAFMKELPELKNTRLSFYTVEGGPVDRFEWPIMKKCMTPLHGLYYSTPDFYPRWPSNWKDWKGPWHGWKWVEEGRKKEIADGDYLFSPFVCAGWSKKPEEDIRPAQWLGLLKCLSVIGAEFYYVGYFNLSPPFTDPAQWAWQPAMPSYAQAVTSRFEDVLRNGNVLFNKEHEPIISWPAGDPHVLLTVRKHNTKEKYVIGGTYQPFSNEENEIPAQKKIKLDFDGHSLSFEVRRQGSIYIYERTPDGRMIFYQLDRWHENAHPDYWSKDFYFEAEVPDTALDTKNIFTLSKGADDYSSFTSYVHPDASTVLKYYFSLTDTAVSDLHLWIRYKGKGTVTLEVLRNGTNRQEQKIQLVPAKDWAWQQTTLSPACSLLGANEVRLDHAEGDISVDKLVISRENKVPAER